MNNCSNSQTVTFWRRGEDEAKEWRSKGDREAKTRVRGLRSLGPIVSGTLTGSRVFDGAHDDLLGVRANVRTRENGSSAASGPPCLLAGAHTSARSRALACYRKWDRKHTGGGTFATTNLDNAVDILVRFNDFPYLKTKSNGALVRDNWFSWLLATSWTRGLVTVCTRWWAWSTEWLSSCWIVWSAMCSCLVTKGLE